MGGQPYPAMEYRHGPIGITDARERRAVPHASTGVAAEEIAATEALGATPQGDPMAELVRVQRLSVALAAAKGLDPDRPRNLSRSVILSSQPD